MVESRLTFRVAGIALLRQAGIFGISALAALSSPDAAGVDGPVELEGAVSGWVEGFLGDAEDWSTLLVFDADVEVLPAAMLSFPEDFSRLALSLLRGLFLPILKERRCIRKL